MLNLKSKIPTYLPLADAAQKYGLSEKALTQQIQAGKIEAVQLPSGELLVAAENNGYKLQTKEPEYHDLFGNRLYHTFHINYPHLISAACLPIRLPGPWRR